jgi:ketosteroid isomerase-like protein
VSRGTPSENVERLQAAADAFNRGDLAPLVELLDEDVDWRGPAHGHLWWKRMPHCHGPEEAAANFEGWRRQASLAPGYAGITLDETQEMGDRVMLGATWEPQERVPAESARRHFLVVTMRDGKIVDIQGCKSRRDALKRLGKG